MAIDQTVTMTEEGKRDLEAELNQLKRVKRPEIAQKIGRAADDGDLSENGAYHNAKEEQGRLEGRIAQLEKILRNAVVAQDTGDVAGISKTVVIEDETGTRRSYRLVSSHEVNPGLGYISDKSPIGSVLMGKKAGDIVEAQTPGRTRRLKVVAVE